MDSETANSWIRTIKRSNSEESYTRFFLTLQKIVSNILLFRDQRYRKLSGTSKTFDDDIKKVRNGLDFLKALGFSRLVEDFREFYVFPPLSTITACKMNDFLVVLNDVVDNLKAKTKNADTIKNIQLMNAVRESEIQAIMKD